jgi:RNAse (barnase) inhibitor barstar
MAMEHGRRTVLSALLMSKPEYIIDGSRFATLEEFAKEFSRVVLRGHDWSGNLDALDDILRGGFGTPAGGFSLRWRNSDLSRDRLGYTETVRQLRSRLGRCHPTNLARVASKLEEAEKSSGPTVFDWLVDVIRSHGPGGDEPEDGVELLLE